ncbi:MAG: tetratricopeptide repeat protein [Chloroflexi bacterium]|nr:tetratricopeptide repeat protein [Chloroflexota bacterium]
MYLRTPKRYQTGHKRRHLFSTRFLWLWILAPIIIVGGWLVYQQRDELGPPVREFIANAVDNASGGIATITAPTPLPTTDPADHIVRGDNAWTQGAIEQAISEYRAAVSGAPNDVRVHYRYTYGLLIEGDNAEALSAAEGTVTANPFSADAWAIRALALERNAKYPDAIASALQALSLDSKNANAMAFMAQTYLDAGQPASAEEKANQAIALDPNNAEAHYALGLFNYSSSYLFDTALTEFQTANELAPNLPQMAIHMAWANWQLENYDLTEEELQQVITNNPNNLDALYAIGRLQYQIYGDPNKAEDFLSRCVESDPKNSPCLAYLALVKIGLGNSQDAAALYQRIIDIGTTDPLDYLHAGRTYATINDCKSAVPLLRTGYQMEQQAAEPNGDRLAAFQEYMSQCNAPFSPAVTSPNDSGTPGAPLLIPLDGG